MKFSLRDPDILLERASAIHQNIQNIRDAIHEEALALSEEFVDRRAESSDGSFCGLTLQVRRKNEGRSVQIYWVLQHFRRGRRVGTTAVDRRRGEQDYDLAAVRAAAPDWLRDIASEIELRARPLREMLFRLKCMDRDLKVGTNHLAIDTGDLPISSEATVLKSSYER